jgi:hypothetical protein
MSHAGFTCDASFGGNRRLVEFISGLDRSKVEMVCDNLDIVFALPESVIAGQVV